jgi:uncharacterized membrane protein YbhN (UPF0104 family)
MIKEKNMRRIRIVIIVIIVVAAALLAAHLLVSANWPDILRSLHGKAA